MVTPPLRYIVLTGLAWVAALALLGTLLQWSGSPAPKLTRDHDGVDVVARSLNETRRASTHPDRLRWTVTKGMAAMREMVIDVKAEQPEQALTIAEQIVTPKARAQYVEILVYVHAVNPQRDPVVRRVQWTPAGGYVETEFK